MVLCFAGARLVLRALPRQEGHATEAFALFWYGVGVVNGLQALLAAHAAFLEPSVALALATWNTRIALALASFAGLVYYLLYVYTGRKRLVGPLAGFYVATFLLMQLWIALSEPVAADVDGWRVALAFARDVEGPLYASVVLMFFVPPLLAALAYAFTLRVVRGAAQRWRVRVVSFSLLAYFLGMTAGYLQTGWAWWGLVENLLGIGAALGVILALRPPAAIRRALAARGDEA